ncbi:MAG: hypothetical protein ABIQ27_08240 [Flavobacterium sp.]|uniref:hypothetical protein n=1 Tax=Flavobacterium sp. TaxID=239 RepID=UPI0032635F6A
MKQLTNIRKASLKYLAIAAFFLSNAIAWAQETTTTTKSVDVDMKVDDGSGDWYLQPWAWIVGAAIFIIIIVGLLKSNNNSK